MEQKNLYKLKRFKVHVISWNVGEHCPDYLPQKTIEKCIIKIDKQNKKEGADLEKLFALKQELEEVENHNRKLRRKFYPLLQGLND